MKYHILVAVVHGPPTHFLGNTSTEKKISSESTCSSQLISNLIPRVEKELIEKSAKSWIGSEELSHVRTSNFTRGLQAVIFAGLAMLTKQTFVAILSFKNMPTLAVQNSYKEFASTHLVSLFPILC